MADIRIEKRTKMDRKEGRRRNLAKERLWLFGIFVPKQKTFSVPLFPVPVFSLSCSGLLRVGEQLSVLASPGPFLYQ